MLCKIEKSFGLLKDSDVVPVFNAELLSEYNHSDQNLIVALNKENIGWLLNHCVDFKNIIVLVPEQVLLPRIQLGHFHSKINFAFPSSFFKVRERWKLIYETNFLFHFKEAEPVRLLKFWAHLKGIELDVLSGLRLRNQKRDNDASEQMERSSLDGD